MALDPEFKPALCPGKLVASQATTFSIVVPFWVGKQTLFQFSLIEKVSPLHDQAFSLLDQSRAYMNDTGGMCIHAVQEAMLGIISLLCSAQWHPSQRYYVPSAHSSLLQIRELDLQLSIHCKKFLR